MNGPPMAPHGLIFSEDGATPSSMLSIWLPALYEAIFDAFLHEMGSGPQTSDLRGQNSFIFIFPIPPKRVLSTFALKAAPWAEHGQGQAVLGPEREREREKWKTDIQLVCDFPQMTIQTSN